MKNHQQRQMEVIDKIEEQVKSDSIQFSVVAPHADYENDKRICLTGVHFPDKTLLKWIENIISSLKIIEPSYFFYPNQSLHMTIKNVRLIQDPPNFSKEDIKKAERVFSEVIPFHHSYQVSFYRLLLFKNNLSLIGTTDPALDEIVLDLDKKLRDEGVPDDKIYANSQYFFSNMTLARFPSISKKFRQKVEELSSQVKIPPYKVDTISLVTGNAAFTNLNIINTWKLLK